MLKFVCAAAAMCALSACGTQLGDRMASGAAIGGGVGLVGGPVGAVLGAGVGAGVGAFAEPDQVNLGEPVWNDPAWNANAQSPPQPPQTPQGHDAQGNPTYQPNPK